MLRELFPKGQRVLDVAALSHINVNQFYGIEIGEFPARIAEVAMWMMDHIMNNRLRREFRRQSETFHEAWVAAGNRANAPK